MSINIKKTNIIVVTKKEVTPSAKITIEGRAIGQVKKFIYLGPGAAESTINTISLIVFFPITFSKYFSKKK